MASEKAPGKQLAKSTEQYQLFEQASRPLFKKYEAAIREMRTRFEILDADLEYRLSRNPIHHLAEGSFPAGRFADREGEGLHHAPQAKRIPQPSYHREGACLFP